MLREKVGMPGKMDKWERKTRLTADLDRLPWFKTAKIGSDDELHR